MKKQILEQIEQFDTIVFHRHVRPDPDALGSQGGLAEIVKASYPKKEVYVVGEEDNDLTFLNRMDDIPDSTYEGALVIVCDTANQERISDQRYDQGKTLIKIDHHPNEDAYGDVVWVDTGASSTSEMIYQFYEYEKDRGLVLPEKAAYLLYAGIVGDTDRFLHSNTTEETFRIAGKLRNSDFSLARLHDDLYKMKLNVARLSGFVLSSFQLSSAGVGHIKLSKDILEEFKASPSEASQLVHVFSHVDGLKAWVFFIEEPKQIRIRFRSKNIVINELAKKYNGGGHPYAAGATIHKWEEADEVLKDLEEVCRKQGE